MSIERANEFGFAPAHDVPISYLQRIRTYYQALGYGAPYEWAHYTEVPFRPLPKPLSRCRIGLITTAAPVREGAGDQGPGRPTTPRRSSMRSSRATPASTMISGSRMSHRSPAHHGRGSGDVLSAGRAASQRCVGPHRLAGAALSRRSDQPKPSRDAGDRWARDRGTVQGGCCRRGHLGAQLSRMPPDRQPGGAPVGAGRHRQRGDGLRQGHRRAGGCAASAVFRLPARQLCRGGPRMRRRKQFRRCDGTAKPMQTAATPAAPGKADPNKTFKGYALTELSAAGLLYDPKAKATYHKALGPFPRSRGWRSWTVRVRRTSRSRWPVPTTCSSALARTTTATRTTSCCCIQGRRTSCTARSISAASPR